MLALLKYFRAETVAPEGSEQSASETMQEWLYSRMETNSDNSESGIHLQLEYSVCFSSPMMGKMGDIKRNLLKR